MNKSINVYDFDGVTSIGVTPRIGDIIVTGRCFDECDVVFNYLKNYGLQDKIPVYFNPIQYATRGQGTDFSRTKSGQHKARIVKSLIENGVSIGYFFEDDPIQAAIIKEENPIMQDKIVLIPKTVEY